MINQKTAAWYLAEAIRTCPIPLAPHQFRRKDRAPHDYVFFGHMPVRTHKRAGQWKFTLADVLHAGRAVAELPWEPEDLVALEHVEQDAHRRDDLRHIDWRTSVQSVVDSLGAGGGCGCPPRQAAAQQSYHPAPDCLLRRYQDYSIACTLPLRTLVRPDETWMIPRTLAYILDQRDEGYSKFLTAGQQCEGCETPSPDSTWRTPTATGWKVICPVCAAASLRRYRLELQGAAYARVRERGPSAAGFLCAVCETARPATDWDHCHGHGLVRGPLCGSCNTMEAQGKEFLARAGSLQHLLRCDGCRAQRSLPPHHRLAALRRHLHLTRGAQGCDWPLHMHVSIEEVDAGYDCIVHCSGPERRTRSLHGLRLTHKEAEHVLSRTVDEGLMPDA
ncbi:endonuclease domain-containing protein [Streptomyces sp. NPDC058391]|uniref:endonuclease domain-containing protein n=1 Tax=Streptomyces sp. NPDC058391 TaxID=3346476 RepID=UPI00364A6B27